MKFIQNLLIGIAAAVIAVALLRAANWDGTKELRLASQPAFDRVMQTRTLRCAYKSMAGYFVTTDTDRNTVIGVAHDIAEQMGRILDLKIVWVGTAATAQVAGDLATGREDAACFPLWPDGPHAGALDYTSPLDYMPVYAYARDGDTRFDGNLPKIDDDGVTVAVIGGGESKTIADEDFPQAAQYSLSDVVDVPHLLLAVTTKNADVTFSDPVAADDFMKNNPGTLRQVANPDPVRVFGESFAVAKGEIKLRDMLNVALAQMQQSGFTRAVLEKYLGNRRGEFFYVGKPYAQQ